MAAAHTAQLEIHADPQNLPLMAAAGMCLFQLQKVPNMDIHRHFTSLNSYCNIIEALLFPVNSTCPFAYHVLSRKTAGIYGKDLVKLTSHILPEGRLLTTPENRAACADLEGLKHAKETGQILEGMVLLCDERHTLHVRLGPFTGLIPRDEAALGIAEGTTRDIAILSRVGKAVCFTVQDLQEKDGIITPLLSRRSAQEAALPTLMALEPGQIIPATVTHLEPFGAFVDIGRGIPSMIGVERLSISRIPHTKTRFQTGQQIYAAVLHVDRENQRIDLTHRELLGTWEENAALLRPGMTLPGYVRSIKEYGAFVELLPNLSGLAECRDGIAEGDRVSVYIKSILPDRMKLKLLILEKLPPLDEPEPLHYFITEGRLERWDYAAEGCEKPGSTTLFCHSPVSPFPYYDKYINYT